ncbi:DUF427 domain-containing protein [Ralstonia chuxiongensis]|uniref:DUF427 domain-containing protein n=1 Tax=Ralstonia chuxiongensis TaxID=2957504 RepID=UPI0028F4D151|nr:DUF427 domain-containing protein [Ralstonia chuxiongensis]CAJ0785242.1 hypothetical protein R8510_05363 [Ralstonia chuxiongensis]
MPDIDPNHPITVESNPRRVTVTLNGFTIASTHLARTLREASYPPVQYIPRDDVQMNLLERTQHHTHCPYKGDASYYTIVAGDVRVDNAVWTYEQPKPVAREVTGYLAFYPDKVTIQEE